MYRKILVPVDLSNADKAERAVKKAEALLDQGGQIMLMNVVEDLPGYLAIDVPMDIIENAVKDAKNQLAILKERSPYISSTEIRSGAPAREILALADETDVDLIVISSHTPDFTNYFIGSTADRVVRHAQCSVLVDR